MIAITGAAGFIGSCMAAYLNEQGNKDLILVDEFRSSAKKENYASKQYHTLVGRDHFRNWLTENHEKISYVIHLGARTDTTEFDVELFDRLNLNYSKAIWEVCTRFQIPLIYASSAATYGLGESGYVDNHEVVENLKPLNPYGDSKNEFDKWVLTQTDTPPHWHGLKFFNVYGPNEYHKGRMASVIFHAFNQIQATDKMNLFRSHRADFEDGKQLRDFVYVKDVVAVINFLKNNEPPSGLYNLGTGKAATFLNLTESVFKALGKTPDIGFIDTPLDIRDKYQYFTQADMTKLRRAGYEADFYDIESGAADYVTAFLKEGKRW